MSQNTLPIIKMYFYLYQLFSFKKQLHFRYKKSYSIAVNICLAFRVLSFSIEDVDFIPLVLKPLLKIWVD